LGFLRKTFRGAYGKVPYLEVERGEFRQELLFPGVIFTVRAEPTGLTRLFASAVSRREWQAYCSVYQHSLHLGGFAMKKFPLGFSMGTAVVFLAMAVGPLALAQQADQDPAPATPHQPEAANQQANQQQQPNEAQMPASGDTTTQEAKTFSGRIVKENGDLVLKDPVTKVTYKLNDTTKAKPYLGKQVKVSGKLDMNSTTIQVDSIEPIS
jgi:Protein of unknown function (DUF5818)